MSPSGLAILIGAGPHTGTGIARILSSPSHSNLAVALIARNGDNLASVKSTVLKSNPDAVIEGFPSDTSPAKLDAAFQNIQSHPSFKGLKLQAAVYSVKHSNKKPFLNETHAEFTKALEEYAGGAMHFAQLSIKRFFADNGTTPLAEGGRKKGTLIFTGTLGAIRTNAEYSSYGASRASVRMLAQGLAKEYSALGVHVAHAIANGRIVDNGGNDDCEEVKTGKWMSADAVGREYAHLVAQDGLYTHELDMRPAQERF